MVVGGVGASQVTRGVPAFSTSAVSHIRSELPDQNHLVDPGTTDPADPQLSTVVTPGRALGSTPGDGAEFPCATIFPLPDSPGWPFSAALIMKSRVLSVDANSLGRNGHGHFNFETCVMPGSRRLRHFKWYGRCSFLSWVVCALANKASLWVSSALAVRLGNDKPQFAIGCPSRSQRDLRVFRKVTYSSSEVCKEFAK